MQLITSRLLLFTALLCPLRHCCSSRSSYLFQGIISGLPSSTSQIILNTLEATCKPKIICPFTVTYKEPLQPDFAPVWFKRDSLISLIWFNDSCGGSTLCFFMVFLS